MAGSFDFLHIKRRTAGSSNELSFDVLDHKSAEADGKARGSKTPKVLKGTYQGVSAPSALLSQEEVEKRKRARQTHRLHTYAFALVIVAALIGVAAYTGMRFSEDRADVALHINELVERLSVVDDTLVEIDEMMADPFDEDYSEKRASLLVEMPKLTAELNRVSVDAQSLAQYPIDEQTEIAVEQVNKAAQTRNGMLTAAAEAFRLANAASEQANRANAIWNDVLAADQGARSAISDANKAATPEEARQALDAMRAASGGFEAALGELRDIEATYGVDFSEQSAYLSKKIEALEYAAVTSEALLAGNREGATSANESYTAADTEAVRRAELLPPSIGDIVRVQFRNNLSSAEELYDEARSRTVAADSVIREYLGKSQG